MRDNLKAMVERIRQIEFNGVLPASLGRVLDIYVELGERPGTDLGALRAVMRVAAANAKEMASEEIKV